MIPSAGDMPTAAPLLADNSAYADLSDDAKLVESDFDRLAIHPCVPVSQGRSVAF